MAKGNQFKIKANKNASPRLVIDTHSKFYINQIYITMIVFFYNFYSYDMFCLILYCITDNFYVNHDKSFVM